MAKALGNLTLGSVEFQNRAFLAPMAGITDRAMRDIAARFGAGMVVSEMIASAALTTGQQDMIRKTTKSTGLPHVVQLAGCESEWLTQAVKIVEDAGADMIDLNLGCPSKRVTNGYAGSALMRVPDIALRLIEATVSATQLPVTVKMRLGWDDESLNAAQIAKSAQDAGVKMVTVHGRTRQQFYKGEARWNLVREVVDALDIPVVVNGDIINFDAAQEALEQSGADAVMIGRGAQGKPWLVGQIGAALAGHEVPDAPNQAELSALMIEHYENMLSDYGVELGVRVARKHMGWYLDGLGHSDAKVRRPMMTEDNPANVMRMLPELLDQAWQIAS